MEQYIPKSALVEWLEKKKIPFKRDVEDGNYPTYLCALMDFEDLLDTLEVKEVDLEKDVRQIISLYYEGIMYYEDVIRKEREENGGSDLAIKIMDGVVDARELNIQYVIDKLKAQKGEQYDR